MRAEWTLKAAAVTVALVLLAPPRASGGWLTPEAREDEARVGPGRLTKLGRGLANIVTSPGELIRTPQAIRREEGGWERALGVGIPYGLWRTALRAVVGVFEVLTFYAEVPADYAPLMHPEFVFEQPPVRRR